MYISDKDKLGYINDDCPPPPLVDPTFQKWRTSNAIIKGWLINYMDLTLIDNFIWIPTSKSVWDAIAMTYFDGSDASQVYELRRRVARLRQASSSLEKFYTELQGLWRDIDFQPAGMHTHHYNTLLQEDRVYTFNSIIHYVIDVIYLSIVAISCTLSYRQNCLRTWSLWDGGWEKDLMKATLEYSFDLVWNFCCPGNKIGAVV
jgi:hypothetical protein